MYSRRFIVSTFVLIIIAVIIVAIVMAVDDDTGDFNIKYSGNSKKYETFIKQGVNRWSSIGTGGVYVQFTSQPTLGGTTVASTSGSTVTISESRFNALSSNLKVLTIAHEVGHVLGIGYWGDSNVLTQGTQHYLSNTKFPKTAKAYVDKVRPTGITLPGPPVESEISLGSGSYKVHWEDDGTLGMQKDLMIYDIRSTSNIISIIDLTYLDEIGKKVDLSQAQSLKATLSASVGEYIFGEEVSPYTCGNCEKCNKQ